MTKITASAALLAVACLAPILSLANCPAVPNVVRIPGTYNWKVANDDNWVAYFSAPLKGSGYSTKVTDFSETRWIQFNSLPDSSGYVECDYLGNYGSEVIRVEQKDHRATPKPNNINWNYTLKRDYPSVAATCAASIEGCVFK